MHAHSRLSLLHLYQVRICVHFRSPFLLPSSSSSSSSTTTIRWVILYFRLNFHLQYKCILYDICSNLIFRLLNWSKQLCSKNIEEVVKATRVSTYLTKIAPCTCSFEVVCASFNSWLNAVNCSSFGFYVYTHYVQ